MRCQPSSPSSRTCRVFAAGNAPGATAKDVPTRLPLRCGETGSVTVKFFPVAEIFSTFETAMPSTGAF
jgi:hypothetical protein